jgi:hypothetical protein
VGVIEEPSIFRQKLSGQAEVCARKALEWLQKDLQGDRTLSPQDVFYLASAADLLLAMRDLYGKK